MASRAASATHMSEGWVATQEGEAPEDRVDAIEAFDGVASLAGVALVAAGAVVVVEVGAAGALEEIASDGCHVADLAGGAGEDGAGEHRVAGAHGRVFCEGGVSHAGANPETAIFALARWRSKGR